MRIVIVLPRDVATRRSLSGGFGLGDLILGDPARDKSTCVCVSEWWGGVE